MAALLLVSTLSTLNPSVTSRVFILIEISEDLVDGCIQRLFGWVLLSSLNDTVLLLTIEDGVGGAAGGCQDDSVLSLHRARDWTHAGDVCQDSLTDLLSLFLGGELA